MKQQELNTDMKTFKEFLQELNPVLLNYDRIAIVSHDIPDYEDPVINERYALIETASDHLYKEIDMDDSWLREQIAYGRYFLGFNSNGNMMSFDRFSVHLYNKYAISVEVPFTVLNMEDFSYEFKNHSYYVISLSVDDIDDIFKVGSYLKADDPDIRLILNTVENNGCLMKGMRVYDKEDKIPSFNYEANSIMSIPDHFQKHESEIIENLINKEFYKSNDLICALTDLHYLEMDVNVIGFNKDHKKALFEACYGNNYGKISEIIFIRESEFEIMDSLNYPVKKDYILLPRESEHIEKGGIIPDAFLYCHAGFISRTYGVGIKNLLISSELRKFFLKYSGKIDSEIFTNIYEFKKNSENSNTTVSDFFKINSASWPLKHQFSCYEPNFLKFDLICFLNMKISDFDEAVNENQFTLISAAKIPKLNLFLENIITDKFDKGSISDVNFILGCFHKTFDWRKLLNKIELGSCISVYDMSYDKMLSFSKSHLRSTEMNINDFCSVIKSCIH